MSQKTSEMGLYSAATPDLLTDLLCIDREGADSYQSTISDLADLFAIRKDDGRFLNQSMRGSFNVYGDFSSEVDFMSFGFIDDGPDAPRRFGFATYHETAYIFGNHMSLEFQCFSTAGSDPGYTAFTIVNVVDEPYLNAMVIRPGVGEVYAFGGGGIVEFFGKNLTETGGQKKLFMINFASGTPTNPPAGSVFMYLDPADGEMKYRKPDGTTRTMHS